jgi:hypothetical protein
MSRLPHTGEIRNIFLTEFQKLKERDCLKDGKKNGG